jgi:hypothetical protein
MISAELLAKLKERYPQMHPLMFYRSIERAKTPGDAFDILETVPDKFPIIWDEEKHCWVHNKDIFQTKRLKKPTRE